MHQALGAFECVFVCTCVQVWAVFNQFLSPQDSAKNFCFNKQRDVNKFLNFRFIIGHSIIIGHQSSFLSILRETSVCGLKLLVYEALSVSGVDCTLG
jgi:hypothetical protein